MAAAELRKAMPQLLDAVRQAVESTEQGPAHVMQPIAGCHPLFSVEDFVSRMKLPEKWQEGEATTSCHDAEWCCMKLPEKWRRNEAEGRCCFGRFRHCRHGDAETRPLQQELRICGEGRDHEAPGPGRS